MESEFEKIISAFDEVSSKGFISGVGKSWGNIGLTFENAIGKSPDSNYAPDFDGVEIKCSTRYSHYPVYLFTLAFENMENEVIRLAEKYGHSDTDFPDKKVLYKRVTNSIVAGSKYSFFFDIDRNENRIYLAVFSNKGELIERKAYINFSTLKKHLETKLKKLAYIKASKMNINGENHYRYYYLALYTLKNFETFLTLIEKNIIVIDIISRISKSGEDRGRYRNKNVEFAISEECLEELFDCIYKKEEEKILVAKID